MSERIVQINAPHFCAALVLVAKAGPKGEQWRCTEAPPILSWAVGKTEDKLTDYFARRGWKFAEVKRP